MKFTKAKQSRIFQDIVDQIERAVLEGHIKPDERLPAERELCEQFKASRGTVREALRILEQKGLVEIRLGAGGGSFVLNNYNKLMSENLSMLIHSDKATPGHLIELVVTIETAIATLAASRAAATDIDLLKNMVLKAQQYIDKGEEGQKKFFLAKSEIKEEICRIAGNPVYGFLLQAVHDSLDRLPLLRTQNGTDNINQQFQDLRMSVYAIGRNDEVLAARQARKNIQRKYKSNKGRH